MTLIKQVEQAFGPPEEERVLDFMVNQELAGCGDDTARWLSLFEKCVGWRETYFLWEESTYIDGISGWNLQLDVCKVRLPENGEDWIVYLCHMALMLVVSNMSIGERTSLAEAGREIENFPCGDWPTVVEYPDGSYAELTPEQWMEELTGFLNTSWEGYRKFSRNAPAYQREMEQNYPKFDAILGRLTQETGDCEVVRMNRHGGDESTWYFARAENHFYVVRVTDSM